MWELLLAGIEYVGSVLKLDKEVSSFLDVVKKANKFKSYNSTKAVIRYLNSLKPEALEALNKKLESLVKTREYRGFSKNLVDIINNTKKPLSGIAKSKLESIKAEARKKTDIQDKINKERNKKNSNPAKEEKEDISDTRISLSSSWMAYGIWTFGYKSASGSYGILEWATKTGYGPYLTPNVSLATWDQMTEAKGINGSGAGSVGWRFGVFRKTRSITKSWNNWRKNTKNNKSVAKFF